MYFLNYDKILRFLKIGFMLIHLVLYFSCIFETRINKKNLTDVFIYMPVFAKTRTRGYLLLGLEEDYTGITKSAWHNAANFFRNPPQSHLQLDMAFKLFTLYLLFEKVVLRKRAMLKQRGKKTPISAMIANMNIHLLLVLPTLTAFCM